MVIWLFLHGDDKGHVGCDTDLYHTPLDPFWIAFAQTDFVNRYLESIIPRLATSELSIFQLVSVAGQASLNLTAS